MERGATASGSDLTWRLPHWHNCLLGIPLGDTLGCMCVCLCACVWARACVNGWTSWMKAGVFLFFFPSCRQEVRSSCWDGDSPHPLATPSHRTSMPVGANLNESHRHTIWMKQTVLTTWLMKVLSNISLPQQTGRSHSAVHIGTGAQKCRHTSFFSH